MLTLVTITDSGVGRRYDVDARCLLGRHPDCDVQIVDAQLSKQHAEIVVDDAGARVRDLDSLNGVYVNGARVDGEQALAPNDLLTLGSQSFVVDPDFQALPTDDGTAVLLVGDEPTQPGVVTGRDVGGNVALAPRLFEVLAGEVTAEAALPEMVARLGEIVPFDAAALLVQRGGKTEAFYVASLRRTVSVPQSIVRRALDERRAFLIADAAGDTSFNHGRSVVSQDLRSVLIAPLLVGEVSLGAVFLTKDEPRYYDEAALDHLVAAAPLLAIAVAQMRQVRRLTKRVVAGEGVGAPEMIGGSAAIAAVRAAVEKASRADSPVLITGETGTGKELVARRLHAGHGAGPWVAVNCGALPEHLVESELFGYEKGAFSGATQQKPGQLELAHGGTLFLDEIGELPAALQVKLLRAIQEKTFFRLGGVKPVRADFRLVTATHRDLSAAVQAGRFREDLYYRIAVLVIDVPPLRARVEDIALLAAHFIELFNRELGRNITGLSAGAADAMTAYRWPGNIRELRNVIERVMVLMDDEEIEIQRGDLPVELLGRPTMAASARTMPERVAQLERRMIVDALKRARGKKIHAAQLLGVSRPTLDRKIRSYAIDIFGEDA